VPDIHDVLHWANRTLVAEEVTRRGFRVSKETLNRWVRQRKEVPAAVEHIVFDMFGIETQRSSPPAWAEGLEARLTAELRTNRELIGALANPELLEAAQRVIARTQAGTPVESVQTLKLRNSAAAVHDHRPMYCCGSVEPPTSLT
jgi:hypothetical protein